MTDHVPVPPETPSNALLDNDRVIAELNEALLGLIDLDAITAFDDAEFAQIVSDFVIDDLLAEVATTADAEGRIHTCPRCGHQFGVDIDSTAARVE